MFSVYYTLKLQRAGTDCDNTEKPFIIGPDSLFSWVSCLFAGSPKQGYSWRLSFHLLAAHLDSTFSINFLKLLPSTKWKQRLQGYCCDERHYRYTMSRIQWMLRWRGGTASSRSHGLVQAKGILTQCCFQEKTSKLQLYFADPSTILQRTESPKTFWDTVSWHIIFSVPEKTKHCCEMK